MSGEVLCVLSHSRDPERPRVALDGLRVCPGHRTQLFVRLHALGAVHEALAAKLQAGSDGGESVAGSRPTGLNPDERVIRCRSEIYTWLASWCRVVAHERRWRLPEDRPAAMGAWLARSLDWLCAMPAEQVEDLFAGLNAHYGTARALSYPSGRRSFVVGGCIEVTWCDVTTRQEYLCPGSLTAVLSPGDDLLPAELVCDTCGVRVPASRWYAFGRRYQEMGRVA